MEAMHVDDQMDNIIEEAEKSLEQLVENEFSFFEQLKSKETRAKMAEGLRKDRFGNHLRSFGAVQAALTVKDARLQMIIDYF